MKCPFCNAQVSRVLESREVDEGSSIRRRRECAKCSHRFTTYERLEVPNLKGMYRAFEKRPVPAVKIEEIISEVERRARGFDSPEINSRKIGSLVMEELLSVDDVAYVRFASVYRSFATLDRFEKELKKIKKLHN